MTPEEMLQQENEARLAQFDFTLAWRLGQLLYERAVVLAAPVSLEVYAFGQELFVAALPGSSADNLEWMRRKRNTVLRCAHSSLYVGIDNASRGESMSMQKHIDHARYTDHGGSFPF
ncbi:heme-binding protein [Erwinia sp. E_sp_B01_9]|uniref:heme-binding protein n=1 Tax=Erwinia sp. E_sp_B01_9 TaxID=3039403 RepID=UPI003D9AE794